MPAGPQILKFQRGLPTSKQFGERLRFLVIDGPDKGTCFCLLGDLIFVGREDSQLLLTDPNISKKHAEIGWRGDHYVCRDLGSANGILHNGKKVLEAPLKAGDILMLGLSVLEVYLPAQTRKNEAPKIKGVISKTKLEPLKPVPDSVERKKKKEMDKKRLMIYAALFFLGYIIFFSGEDKVETFRERANISATEEGGPKKKLSKKDLKAAIAEFVPDYTLETPQRKDAEIFFRNGVREIQNKNFRRAIMAFETALTVDPSHDLAKIYLKSARKDMEEDIKSTAAAAVRARKSLRFKEARMHYENILRLLDGLADEKPKEDLVKSPGEKKDLKEKSMAEFVKDAKDALVEIEKEENRIR